MEFPFDKEWFFGGELLGKDNLEHLIGVVLEVFSSGVAEEGGISRQWEIQSGIDESETILSLPESNRDYSEGSVGIFGKEYDLSFILIK